MKFASSVFFVFCLVVLVGCRGGGLEAVSVEDAQVKASPVEIVERIQAERGAVVAKLSNGMTVIARAVHTAPVVSVRAYVRAGGLYEKEWLGCGISHLCEHLVAEYSTTSEAGHLRSKSHAARSRLEDIGGQANAYTTLSHTCYYISAAASKTNECIDLIADQIARPEITTAYFKREHGVVQRELEMGKDDPRRIMYYTHQANLYGTHPAAVPVIGYADPLGRVTYEDVRTYHGRMYVPQNIIFVVVGDIDPQAAIERVVRGMQGFYKGRSPEFTLPETPPVSGVRRVVRHSAAFKEAAQLMSFPTIPLIHPDLYALDVLSHVLSRGRSSRLARELKFNKRLVTSIDSWSDTPHWGRGAFTVTFRADPTKADAAEKAILEELRRVIREGVTADELDRAKRQKIAEYLRSQQTMESIASTIATDFAATGDLGFSQNYTDNIQKVTPEQVRAMAEKYFHFDAMVITRMLPATGPEVAEKKTTPQVRTRTEVYTLPNGLKVVLKPTETVGLVSMAMAVQGGLLMEERKTNGLGSLMVDLSTRGAGELSAEQITSFFNSAGGSISTICGDNTFLWQGSVLSGKFDRALDILSDIVLRPTFPEKELEIIRPLAVANLKRVEEHWFYQLRKFFRDRFFTQSPWGMISQGDLRVIENATVAQIAAYHEKILKAGSSVLAVCGDFDPAAAKKLIDQRFGAFPGGTAKLDIPAPRRIGAKGELHVQKSRTKQAGIIVAAPGTTISNIHDRLALMLIDTIISGYHMPDGWLHKELRGKELVYVVHAYHKTGFAPGAFITYAATQPQKAVEVVDIIKKNMRKAADYLPTQKELDRAINTIVTAEMLNHQTVEELATGAGLDELYGLGVDWPQKLRARLKQLTPEQVRTVARKYLGGQYVVTVITPAPERFGAESIVQQEKETQKVK